MDLIALVADKNMEFALRGVLSRHQALEIRPLIFQVKVHAGHDGGVRKTGVDILRLEQAAQNYLLMLDYEGSGAGDSSPLELEGKMDLELQLKLNAKDRSKAIVIDPECDVWMWGSDNSLAEILNWEHALCIRDWLRAQGFDFRDTGKPMRPKEALEAVFRQVGMPRSSALYRAIASRVSLRNCTDLSFARLRSVLQDWFPPTA